MKGNPQIIDAMDRLLANETAAYQQYLAHAAFARNSGYVRLAGVLKEHAKDERHHAVKLIDRIVLLEGRPNVAAIGPVAVGSSVP
jgi:bacterioferritin